MTEWTDQWLMLRAATSFEQLSALALARARRIALADGATFVLRDGDNCFYVDEDAIAPLWKGQRFPVDTCISGWAMQTGQAAEISDITVDERIPQDAYRPTFVRSLVMTPMGEHEPVGAIGTYWARTGVRLDAASLDDLRRLAHLVGKLVQRLDWSTAPWAPNFALRSASKGAPGASSGPKVSTVA